jgi:hypothetical protein
MTPQSTRCPLAVVLCLLAGVAQADEGRARPANEPFGAAPIERGDETHGRWRAGRADPAAIESAESEDTAEIERLSSLGYAAGKRPVPSPRVGVTLHERDRACPGWNVVNSAHVPGAFLMDMEGEVRWRWERAYDDLFPAGPTVGVRDTRKDMWRRARLLPGGDLVVVFESLGIARLDSSSRTVWATEIPAHHDFELLADGSLLVLTREARTGSGRHANRPILEDFVTRLDGEGRTLARFSLLEAASRSALAFVFEASVERGGDLFHANSLRSIDGSLAAIHPEFRAGHLLVSLRNIDTIILVDPRGPAVVWLDQGSYRRQHDARLLPSGRILLFDNGDGASRVLEVDPGSREVLWEYGGEEGSPLFSEECGLAQRLPNGNTLVTETDAGRAVEVDPGGRIVWEYRSPFRAGARGELVAAIFEVERIALEAGNLLAAGGPPPGPGP